MESNGGVELGIVALSLDAPPNVLETPFLEHATSFSCKEEDPLETKANRFKSMIERIECIYRGGNSVGENDDGRLGGDQYDSDDTFIDNLELDEYFRVPHRKNKRSSFYISRGPLEQINIRQKNIYPHVAP